MPSSQTDPFSDLSIEQLLATIPSGMMLVDTRQRIVCWNSAAERITGYTRGEVLGRPCSVLEGIPCGNGTCGLFSDQYPKPITGVRCSIRDRSGRRLTLLKNVDLLRNKQGEIVGGVESFVDITRQETLENRLRARSLELRQEARLRTRELAGEQARLRTLLDTMPDLAYIRGADHRISFINRPLARLTGGGTGDLCHCCLFGLDKPCPDCPMDRIAEGKPVTRERTLPANGLTYEVLDTPYPAGDGTIHKLSIMRDVTGRKKTEKRLREANRDLDAFALTVAHDLKAPLTPIIGFTQLLRDQLVAEPEALWQEPLSQIEDQARRLLHQLEDLLDFARLGHIDPPPVPVDTTALVRAIIEAQRHLFETAGMKVSMDQLPPISIPSTLLSQLFTNLIVNALLHGSSPDTTLEIGGKKTSGALRYHVRDHGAGIPAKERSTVFQLFTRSTATRAQGTGVGLAIVKRIVDLYLGKIWVESTAGGGATFVLEFPEEKQLPKP